MVNNGVSANPLHYHPVQMSSETWASRMLDRTPLDKLMAISMSTVDECLSHALVHRDWHYAVWYQDVCYAGAFL